MYYFKIILYYRVNESVRLFLPLASMTVVLSPSNYVYTWAQVVCTCASAHLGLGGKHKEQHHPGVGEFKTREHERISEREREREPEKQCEDYQEAEELA